MRLLRLNDKGMEFYLSYYKRELEKIRVTDWTDSWMPPSPPVIAPMPQFSRDFFEDSGEILASDTDPSPKANGD